MAPTAAGAEFLSHARQVEAALMPPRRRWRRTPPARTGRVRLGTGATACIYLLPPLLRDLRRRFPDLEISVSTGNTPDMLRAIEENRIDLGLVTLPAAGRALDIRPLIDDEFVLVAPRGSMLPREITAAELARLALVQYELGANTRRLTDAWAMRAGASRSSR